MLNYLAVAVLSYLTGSIPTAVIYSKLFKGVNIREHGSKNAGATNVFRVLGPIPGILVLLVDAAKGYVAVALISKLQIVHTPDIHPVYLQLLAAVSVSLGHIFTLFASFKGGKGIATGAGALLAIIPRELGLGIVVFAIIVYLTRFISLGSMCAAVFISLLVTVENSFAGYNHPTILILTCWGLTLLIFYTHRKNIRRLMTGTESKIGKKSER